MCTANGTDRTYKQFIFDTKSVQISATTETLHCDLSASDPPPPVTHLVRVNILKKIYSDIRVTGRWVTGQSLLQFALTGGAVAAANGGWTETKSVVPASTSTQEFNSTNIKRTGQPTPIDVTVDIETKVEGNPPWQPPNTWYTVDTVGFAVKAMQP
jgi:hypothetical protein